MRSYRTLPAVRLGSLPADEEDLRFVQDRLALLAKTTFLIAALFLLVTSLADVLGSVKRYTDAARTCHAVGTLLALVVWRTAYRREPFTPAGLQALAAVGTIGLCWSFAAMGHFAVQPFGFYTGLLAVTHVSVARAMIVPSIPLRSFVLGVVGSVGIVLSRVLTPWPLEIALVAGPRPRIIVEALLWSTAAVAVATVASTVIYGLQERAREARQLGQYTLEAKIGEGGMGVVYRARHAMLRRPTAVKLLAGGGGEDQLRRFEKEVQLTARLTHPNTVSVFDYGRTPDGVFYYAMELLDGMTLEQLVERHGPQPAGRVIHILVQICGALTEAHGTGLIHRDIKPANIHLCRRGDVPDFVKVLDFGLVREIANDVGPAESQVGAVVRTPLYMAPEAILAPEAVDARGDIYGLEGVADFLLAGAPAFSGHNMVELCAHQLHTAPAPLSEHRDCSADLEGLVLACLAKDPAARPQTARALARALESCRDAATWTERDADAWWSEPANAWSPPQVTLGEAETLRQTIVRVDLERRTPARDRGA